MTVRLILALATLVALSPTDGDCGEPKELKTLEGDKSRFGSLAFSPDGKTLASTDQIGVKLWDVASGKQSAVLEKKDYSPRKIAFNSDGKALATLGSGDKKIVLWEMSTRKELRVLDIPEKEFVLGIAFRPKSPQLISWGKTLRFWDSETGKEIANQRDWAPNWQVKAIDISSDGKLLAVGLTYGFGGGVEIWDLETRKKLIGSNSGRERGSPWNVAFTPDSKSLLFYTDRLRRDPSTPFEPSVSIWNFAEALKGEPEKHGPSSHFSTSGQVSGLAFSPDGKWLLLTDQGIVLHEWKKLNSSTTLKGYEKSKKVQYAFSPDSNLLATSDDQVIKIWTLDGDK